MPENFQNQFKLQNSLIQLFPLNMTLFFQFCCKRYLKIKFFFVDSFKNLCASVCVIFSKTTLEKI